MYRARMILCLGLVLGFSLLGGVGAQVDFAVLEQTAPVERVQETLGYLAGLGSRVAGYPGAKDAALFIEKEFRGIGLQQVTVQEYDVSIPIDKRDGTLEIVGSGAKMSVYGIWPNLVKTSTLPEDGFKQISGPTVVVKNVSY